MHKVIENVWTSSPGLLDLRNVGLFHYILFRRRWVIALKCEHHDLPCDNSYQPQKMWKSANRFSLSEKMKILSTCGFEAPEKVKWARYLLHLPDNFSWCKTPTPWKHNHIDSIWSRSDFKMQSFNVHECLCLWPQLTSLSAVCALHTRRICLLSE